MLLELRTYDLRAGKAPVYLEFFRTFGVGLVTRHLPMMGYWLVESGRLNRIEHLWAYESFEERDACRASLVKDSAWMNEFVPEAFVDVVTQSNRFLTVKSCTGDFQMALDNRKAHHPNQPKDSAMFNANLYSLMIGGNIAPSDTEIARLAVVSGSDLGQEIVLSRGPFDTLLNTCNGAETHEVLRPISLSPLC